MQPLLWKSNDIAYYVCAFVALGIQHAMCMRRVVVCGPPWSTILFCIISKMAIFGEKKEILNTKCVF